MKQFKEKVTNEYRQHRYEIRENFTWFENFCKESYSKGNFFDKFSRDYDVLSGNENEIQEIISLNYIKSHSYGFRVRPTIKGATDLLRNLYIDQSIRYSYSKNPNHALIEILKQVRDNITHHGKFEITSDQMERNFILVKNCSIILARIISFLESSNKADDEKR